MKDDPARGIEVLLVEDNPGDVLLMREAFKHCKLNTAVSVASDGEQALQMLLRHAPYKQQPLPDLILLDLNLPKKDGHELLDDIKGNPELAHIPVIVLTSSRAESDIATTYRLRANSYIVKPVSLASLTQVVCLIEKYWLSMVESPARIA